MKEFYRLEEASKYLSRKLDEEFNIFDILLTAAKNKLSLSMYHSGFIGVSSWLRDFRSSERVVKRIPFDGIVEITSLGYIEEVSENSEFTVTEIIPKHWIRHDLKKARIIEELSKIDEPSIYMVDHTNVIYYKTISINKLLISQENLVALMIHLKGLSDEPIDKISFNHDINGNKYIKLIDGINDLESKDLTINPAHVASIAKMAESNYSTGLLKIQNLAINEFFNPRKSVDAKQDEVVEWIKAEGKKLNIGVSDNVAASMFTIIKPPDHNPKKKRA